MSGQVVYQAGLFGMAGDQVAGDVVDRCRAMLLEEPETRRDYKLAYLRYLKRYCDLDYWRARPWEEFEAWYVRRDVPDYRTVANRCQELIRADAGLRPPAEVMARRQKQRRQGRVR
ncbi:MAG: hypothetical protein JW900_07390 [Anaerolineae bacterium]|nr:hypothetical protein [Anaerolineae bacterium]